VASAGDVRLVDLHDRAQPLAAGTDHRGSVAMQHRPRRLLRADAEHTLEAQGGDPVLLAGHLPRRREPHRQRGPSAVKDRAGRRRDTPTASTARPVPIGKLPCFLTATERAQEAARPAQPVQVVQARSIIRKPAPKVRVGPGVVNGCPRLLPRHPPNLLHRDGGPIRSIYHRLCTGRSMARLRLLCINATKPTVEGRAGPAIGSHRDVDRDYGSSHPRPRAGRGTIWQPGGGESLL
jgi:hypothetical protein